MKKQLKVKYTMSNEELLKKLGIKGKMVGPSKEITIEVMEEEKDNKGRTKKIKRKNPKEKFLGGVLE